jgi:LmbE family N-acetylglucosaminyl deacetylase
MKVLVIAPHPDDEVLGCGGTMKKHSQAGDEVFLCIVTKAYTPNWSAAFIKERKNEIEKSCKALGVKKAFFLDFKTVQLDTVPQQQLNQKIADVVKAVRPEVVYIPHQGDMHNDHRLVFYASLVATRPAHAPSVERVLSYETLSETDWSNAIAPFIPNVYVDVSETINDKIKAMQAYGSEVKELPHSRSLEMIKILAQKRGAEINVSFAEAFILIRQIYGRQIQ